MAVGKGLASNASLRSNQNTEPCRLVRAALADDVDLGGAESLVSGVGSARDLELLDGILRQNDGWRYQGRIGVDQAVEGVVVALGPAAVHADGISFALAHRALLTANRDGASTDQEQLHEIAPIQGKIFHLLLADQVGKLGVSVSSATACAVA